MPPETGKDETIIPAQAETIIAAEPETTIAAEPETIIEAKLSPVAPLVEAVKALPVIRSDYGPAHGCRQCNGLVDGAEREIEVDGSRPASR